MNGGNKIKKYYSLQNISGNFLPGRFTAILGASGAGKTSFLSLLAGELDQGICSGTIQVNGKQISASDMKDISG